MVAGTPVTQGAVTDLDPVSRVNVKLLPTGLLMMYSVLLDWWGCSGMENK